LPRRPQAPSASSSTPSAARAPLSDADLAHNSTASSIPCWAPRATAGSRPAALWRTRPTSPR
jgi:hypothetical protein